MTERDSLTYAQPAGEPYAGVSETLSAVVFFAGDRAYKLKKPVSTGFLDFSTPQARAAACQRETELNRRFALDVYLGVAQIRDPDGQVCDHLVVMRRMPAARRLSVAVHHPRLSGYRRRGAAGANCLLAMVTTSRRVRSEPPARGLAHRQLFRRPGRWQEGRRSCCWSCCYPPPLDVVGVCLSLLAGQQLRPAWIPWPR